MKTYDSVYTRRDLRNGGNRQINKIGGQPCSSVSGFETERQVAGEQAEGQFHMRPDRAIAEPSLHMVEQKHTVLNAQICLSLRNP